MADEDEIHTCKVCGAPAYVHTTSVEVQADGTQQVNSEHLCYAHAGLDETVALKQDAEMSVLFRVTHAGLDETVERKRDAGMSVLFRFLVEQRRNPTPEEVWAMGALKNAPGTEGFKEEWEPLQHAIKLFLERRA
jgi:hypothetical protein